MKFKIVAVPLVVLGVCFGCLAGMITQELSFSNDELSLREFEGYHLVEYIHCGHITEIGKPCLPAVPVQILLPSGAELTGVEVFSVETSRIPGEYEVYPCQPPVPIGTEEKEFVPPDESVYSSTSVYPSQMVRATGTGSMGGYAIAHLVFHPVQYIPAKKELLFNHRVVVHVHYESTPSPRLRSERQSNLLGRSLEKMVVNPEDVAEFAPPIRRESKSSALLPSDDVGYVIISTSDYVSVFQELADWKTKKGVPTQIVDLDYVTSNYSGDDIPEQVRNFIIDADSTWGTVYFLLAGDPSNSTIPIRLTTDLGLGPYGTIASDLYYSDLDGDWNGDGDGTYGETTDDVDMYSDVFVGRASVGSIGEAEDFVDKVLTYEKTPASAYLQKVLLPSELLFESSNFWGDTVGNAIADITPANFSVCKLYESMGNLNAQAVLDSIGAGYHLVHYASHGNYNVISTNPNSIYSSDVDGLTNGSLLGIHVAICCIVGRLDYEDCIVEHFMNNLNGGTVAWIGNSRDGWGAPPALGSSERLDIEFFDNLFNSDLHHLGSILAATKDAYIPYAVMDNYYRYCLYGLNLFGDPELMVWTKEPGVMTVEHPSEVVFGPSDYMVRVTDNSDPIGGALVCVMGGDEVYAYGYTLPSGEVALSIHPLTVDTLLVTVTAHNYLPYEANTTTAGEGAYVIYESHLLYDMGGDGLPNPGEVLDMSVTISNQGANTAWDVGATISTDDAFVTILDSISYYGDILSGQPATGTTDYQFSISPSCTNSHWVSFSLQAKDSSDKTWTSFFNTVVAAPVVSYSSHTVNDASGGNGNGILEPGETADLWMSVTNTGLARATNVTGHLSTQDSYIDIGIPDVNFGDIDPGATENSHTPFGLSADPGSPDPRFPLLNLDVAADDYSFADSFLIAVGTPGFMDSMENGQGEWTHDAATSGYRDEWHLETYRYNSASHSWKCGGPGSGTYANLLDAALLTPRIILLPGCKLSFWHWIQAEEYNSEQAWDGGFVEISTDFGGTWEQIQPVGGYSHTIYPNAASPFLPGTPCYSGSQGWTEAEFDLSSYSGVIQFRFRFGSDGYTTEEGWYIDDVAIEEPAYPVILIAPLSITAEVEQGNVTNRDLTISNIGNGLLQFQIEIPFSCDWLDAQPLSGELEPDSSIDVLLTLDATNLSAGNYQEELQVISNDPVHSSKLVPVDLTVLSVFVRGDANSNIEVTMEDAICILRYIYIPGSPPLPCDDAGDTNDDGELTMSDATGILKYLYVPGTPPLPQPFPECGVDPTADGLGCDTHECMQPVGVKKAGSDIELKSR